MCFAKFGNIMLKSSTDRTGDPPMKSVHASADDDVNVVRLWPFDRCKTRSIARYVRCYYLDRSNETIKSAPYV